MNKKKRKFNFVKWLFLFLSFVFCILIPIGSIFYQYDFFSKETKIVYKFITIGIIVAIILAIYFSKYISKVIATIENDFVKCALQCLKYVILIVLCFICFGKAIDSIYNLVAQTENFANAVIKMIKDLETLIIAIVFSVLVGNWFFAIYKNECKKDKKKLEHDNTVNAVEEAIKNMKEKEA